ncbi:MAG TPA: hypothetical protein VH740_21315 [Vicinamibacterales bacterium]|jgi:hypothetical protein
MNRERRAGTAAGVLFVCAFAAAGAHAQSASDGRWEAGGFVGAIDFRDAIREKPVALGLRFGHRFTDYFALEAELSNCPKNGGGNFGQRVFVAGPRASVSFGPLTIGGKLRAGIVYFGGKAFRASNPDIVVRPAVNVGAVVELAMSPRSAIRIDSGTTIVPFGSAIVRGPLPPHAAQYGTTHNREGSIGLVIRF